MYEMVELHLSVYLLVVCPTLSIHLNSFSVALVICREKCNQTSHFINKTVIGRYVGYVFYIEKILERCVDH